MRLNFTFVTGPKISSRGYFVGPKFFLADVFWVTREYISKE